MLPTLFIILVVVLIIGAASLLNWWADIVVDADVDAQRGERTNDWRKGFGKTIYDQHYDRALAKANRLKVRQAYARERNSR